MEALVAILVALIAACAGFAGGYFGARWQAQGNLAQWRRDQLLKFCVDLLEAGDEVEMWALEWLRGKRPDFPRDATRRQTQAFEGIALLSSELTTLAGDYRNAAVARIEGVTKGSAKEEHAMLMAYVAFIAKANNLLTSLSDQPKPWDDLRRHSAKAWTKAISSLRSEPGMGANDATFDSTGATKMPANPRDTSSRPS